MRKGTNFISEIGKYFKENNATSAMQGITNIFETVILSERMPLGKVSNYNCKFSQLQMLQLLLLFYCFLIKKCIPIFRYSEWHNASLPYHFLLKSGDFLIPCFSTTFKSPITIITIITIKNLPLIPPTDYK